jgi:hypothetical protein
MMAATIRRGVEHVRRAWASDAVRLIALTLYYLAIIVGLAVGGGRRDVHPPFVYQAF